MESTVGLGVGVGRVTVYMESTESHSKYGHSKYSHSEEMQLSVLLGAMDAKTLTLLAFTLT